MDSRSSRVGEFVFPYISISTVETVNRISGNSSVCATNVLYYNAKENTYFKIDHKGFLHTYASLKIEEDIVDVLDRVLDKDNIFFLHEKIRMSVSDCELFFSEAIELSL